MPTVQLFIANQNIYHHHYYHKTIKNNIAQLMMTYEGSKTGS